MDLKAQVIAEQEEAEEMKQQQPQHFHVLAVDDNMIERKVLERLLRISSYKVTCVESGDKALKYLGLLDDHHQNDVTSSSSSYSSPKLPQHDQELKVNLIMTDYCMPGMSGYDLLKRIKGSSWKDVPVVVMSSENIPSRINMCLEGGAEEFLLKPVQLSDLKKLKPYLDHQSCSCTGIKEEEDRQELTVEINNDTSNTVSENNNIVKNNNNNNVSKRKAVSAEASDRISKMKEMAVV